MERRFGVTGSVSDGIFFAEGPIPKSTFRKHLQVEISRQNSNLGEVKRQLASDAKTAGANAIANFTYGQKAHSWLGLLTLKWDTESWHGEGDAVVATE